MKHYIKIYTVCEDCRGSGRRPDRQKNHDGVWVTVGDIDCSCENGYDWVEYRAIGKGEQSE